MQDNKECQDGQIGQMSHTGQIPLVQSNMTNLTFMTISFFLIKTVLCLTQSLQAQESGMCI
jgi:hypothetical protein